MNKMEKNRTLRAICAHYYSKLRKMEVFIKLQSKLSDL